MYLELDTARIFFDCVGAKLDAQSDTMAERPTFLVLHGGPGYDHSNLRPYFDRFADMFQVIYIDHRGCGRSGGAQETWFLDQWADDIADFCARLGIEKPLVFGNSFGGMVAMHFAARHPDKLSRVILSSTAARFELEETVKTARRLGGDHPAAVADAFFSDPTLEGYAEYAKVVLPLYTQAQDTTFAAARDRSIHKPEVTVHFFRNEMMEMDLRPELAAITCPALVLGGAEDPVTPALCSRDIADAIGTNAQLEIFESCGHGVFRDDPDRAEKVMRAFLTAG